MQIAVTDMHTGGEPVRIIDARFVTSGWPEPEGNSILEKRNFARTHQDQYRKFLMFEPRGHYDMYGALIVKTALPGADFGVLFMHNEGWSTMCGHAVIALGRYAVDQGWVEKVEPFTRVGIECPCGLVVANVTVLNGKAGAVSFTSVPAFLWAKDLTLELPDFGKTKFDIAYGGAFYALADGAQFGLVFGKNSVRHFVDAADCLTEAVRITHKLSHPESADLAFLYGSILTDGGTGKSSPTKNICVFADREVDRSPTGSGVTARLAAMHAKRQIDTNETLHFESITGAIFTGAVETVLADYAVPAISARVGGMAYYSGQSQFTIETDDPLGGGFLVR